MTLVPDEERASVTKQHAFNRRPFRPWVTSCPGVELRTLPCFRKFFLDSYAVHRETGQVSKTAHLSLGSNLGDRAANLRAAAAQLEVAGRLLAVSALY